MKISVVIPAYNAACFLPRCLESVSMQTLKPDEVIVVDDGSTDDTAEVAIALGAKVIRRVNGGISAARNTGIQNALCDWIALLDADDLWAPQKLERQVACIRPETVLVYTGARLFDDKGSRGESRAIDPTKATKMLRYCNPIIPSSVLVWRGAAMRGGGFREDIRTCEDWEMWVRLLKLGQFGAVTEPLTEYYLHAESLSADPEAMLRSLDLIIETSLVSDLRGLRRWTWRRRIRATQLASAGLIARDNQLKNELRYMFQSLFVWPSPFWQPRRFALLAVSAINRIRR
jgi:glycosyltransferase involved in cell wall biosynthesis